MTGQCRRYASCAELADKGFTMDASYEVQTVPVLPSEPATPAQAPSVSSPRNRRGSLQ